MLQFVCLAPAALEVFASDTYLETWRMSQQVCQSVPRSTTAEYGVKESNLQITCHSHHGAEFQHTSTD